MSLIYKIELKLQLTPYNRSDMKKYLLYILLLTAVVAGCKKDKTETILDSPDVRLNAELTKYQTQLASSTFGWKGFIATGGEEVYSFLFKFTDKNRVTMSADYETEPLESSYRLKALQQPILLFDTYSTLHILQDPDPSKNGGATGEGRSADFEFKFLSATADTIKLEGTFNKSKLILVRSTSEADNAKVFDAGYEMAGTLSRLRTYFKRMVIDAVTYEVKLDPSTNTVSFSNIENAAYHTVSGQYYVDGSQLVLFSPLVLGKTTITQINGITYDPATGFIKGSITGAPIEIKEAITPLLYDNTIAAIFNAGENQYSSFTGFTKDGQTDALNILAIPGMTRLLLWTKYGPNYDLAGFTFGNSIRYGPAVIPTVTSDGYVKYSLLGYLGTLPAAYSTIIRSTGNAFLDTKGFYVIQTSPGKFDMVGVTDARTWISFQ